MKQIFVVFGEPMTGKSILFNQAVKVEHADYFDTPFFEKRIKDQNIKSVVIDDFIVNNINCKTLAVNLLKIDKLLDYVIIISNCEIDKQYLLIDRLATLNIPISICDMKKVY